MYRIMKFHPLEREYEGWIVRELQDYFRNIGIEPLIHAVGYERTFPADEFVKAGALKVFALQFKRPQRDPKTSRMYWQIQTSTNQFGRVLKEDGIYYALPTFFNRDLSRVSLQHLLVWHPEFHDGELLEPVAVDGHFSLRRPADFWPAPHSAAHRDYRTDFGFHEMLGDRWKALHRRPRALRWGRFAEGLFDCPLGIALPTAASALKKGPKGTAKAADKITRIVSALLAAERGEDVQSVVVGLTGGLSIPVTTARARKRT